MFKYICLFFLFSFTATNLDAENRHTYFHHINTHHGLASNNVYSILQDSEGFLWFATANGLSRYDGYTFKTFKEIIIDTDTVRFSIIRSLYEDRDGIVWIGTEKSGLIRYDRLKESFTYFNTQNSPLLSNKIYKVYQDKNLNYWIGTSTGLNVVKYENQKLISVDDNALSVVPSKLKKEGVKAIYEDKEGHIWIGTLKGNAFSYIWDGSFYLLRYNVSMSEVLNHNISRNINSIIQTKDGILWFAFWGGGLWCYNKLNDEFYNYFEKNSISLHSDIITDLAVRENELYFSSWNDGLYKLNIETNNLYNWRQQSYNPYGLGNNELRTVMIDNRGNVFTGASSEAGVNVLLKQSLGFKVFRLKTDNLEEDITVQHFEPDGRGNLYISTKSGVYVRKLNNSPCIDVPLPLNKSGNQEINIRAHVSCYDSVNNLLWIGTEGKGLAKYNFATQTVYFYPIVFDSYTDTSLSSTVIMDLYLDNNKLWIGSWSGGLSMLNIETERFIHYEIPNTDYSTNVVIDIEPENDSVLWLATFGKGILRYSKKTNTAQSFFYTSQGKYKGEGTFLQIKKASDGKIWAGTLNSGVIRFDYLKKDFQIIDFTDNQTITSASVFVEDNNNNMWIGCNQGLLSVNQKLEVEVYSHNIGLLNNSYPVGAGISLDNNKIWISGNKNILEFVPENVVVNDYEEKPIITNLIINNENADLYTHYRNLDTIELDYYQNSFSIQFSTMNFINKKAVSYKYMLEGIDSDWKIISSPERSASYTNLPAGVYTFVLYANCPKNGWTREFQKIHIRIEKPYWQKWWFYALLGFLFFVFVFIVIRIRTFKLEKKQDRLEKLIRARTEQVMQQSEEIIAQRDSIMNQKSEIEKAHKDTTDSIEYAKQIQDAMLPSKLVFKTLFPESFVFYRPLNIVSGDFYWVHQSGNKTAIVVADSTGHGVPGAFLSILGISLLNDIINTHSLESAATILNILREHVKTSLNQNGKIISAKDGMDMSMCIIDSSNRTINYAGAYNPIYIFDNNTLQEYKADKMPIGYHLVEHDFTDYSISYNQGNMLYMFTDGFYDQFGGEYGKKLKTKRFKNILSEIHTFNTEIQKQQLNNLFYAWINPGTLKKYSQLDDIVVIGIRL